MKPQPGGHAVLFLWLIGRAAIGADAQTTWDQDSLGEVVEAGTALIDALVPPYMRREVALPEQQDWNMFWGSLQSALSSDDPDDLAAMGASAREALTFLDSVPALEPMADWLRQRLDYLDAAAETDPMNPATTTPCPAVGPLKWPRSAAPVTGAGPKPGPHKAMASSVHQAAYWRQRLRGRTVPSGRATMIPNLKRIFREEGVPAELVWMAETESTLNPAACSPAGAAGLFQIMPATAGRFGLKLRPCDE